MEKKGVREEVKKKKSSITSVCFTVYRNTSSIFAKNSIKQVFYVMNKVRRKTLKFFGIEGYFNCRYGDKGFL